MSEEFEFNKHPSRIIKNQNVNNSSPNQKQTDVGKLIEEVQELKKDLKNKFSLSKKMLLDSKLKKLRKRKIFIG